MKHQKQPLFKPLILAIPLSVSVALYGISPVLAADNMAQVDSRYYSIPAGSLDSVLNQFALTADVSLSINSALTTGKRSSGLNGDYTQDAALAKILANTNLVAQQTQNGSYIVKSEQGDDGVNLPTITIEDNNAMSDMSARDQKGYDDVYDKNTSTTFIGKTEVERYKGTTPSDLLQGVPGVFSGEARNSGALDLNIRGVQGPGRVPVTIDGTEQALTVWRGYNGATNRNYIDPNLIGNVQIYKGATNERDVHSGVGGAMVVKTLSPDDLIRDGETFGAEFKIEGSSNATGERVPALHTGELATDVDGYPAGSAYPYADKTLRVNLKSKSDSDNNPLNGGDYAYRVAAAKKSEHFDVLAAYAYRERGNYYSGKNNTGYYNNPSAADTRDYITSLAQYWQPGDEVTNTSSLMESWLLKTTWHIDDDQKIGFNFRQSDSTYGEIMPSRINNQSDRSAIQWPLSEVTAKAYNIEYSYKPIDNRWIDFNANLWRTDTVSDTYTSGGFPNQTLPSDTSGVLYDNAVANANSTRDGITLSNKMNLTDTLDLTLGGRFQHEKLTSDDEYDEAASAGWRMLPRAGRREEWETNFDFAWRPTDKLKLNAGMTYSAYWAFDDFLAAHPGEFSQSTTDYYNISYSTGYVRTDEEIATLVAERTAFFKTYLDSGAISQAVYDQIVAGISYDKTVIENTYNNYATWKPDADGNYDRADNPCLNGELAGKNVVSCQTNPVNNISITEAKKHKDHGWVPHAGISYQFTDYSRAYLTYTETLRYPSMFESTMAFSASQNPYGVKPEHAHNWELAYVHDLTQWFSSAEHADVKIAYYDNLTEDVIERDSNFKFNNVDEQKIRGIELSARYDNGRFFTGLGVNYTLQNEICDEDSAAMLSTNDLARAVDNPIPRCFKYGFPNGYQLAQATPELSANLSLGGRFMDRRLEIGGRATYYKGYENSDLDWYIANSYGAGDNEHGYVYFYNTPYSWGDTLIFDAYVRYKINEIFDVELTGSNLSDQYYVDPATRSAVAAPGRTFKLGLTGRF
ncbi:TonB-dependent receptor [Marinomonas sp. BSi20584]|uniref:TonB-dependent receptor n=1 Tax=Marinomonas sp. BSi20584 TaxID=1594462 RepID=UPI000C1EA50A|nr:TonB-dependent receptor [Marinomonas sp. BSi20584]